MSCHHVSQIAATLMSFSCMSCVRSVILVPLSDVAFHWTILSKLSVSFSSSVDGSECGGGVAGGVGVVEFGTGVVWGLGESVV